MIRKEKKRNSTGEEEREVERRCEKTKHTMRQWKTLKTYAI